MKLNFFELFINNDIIDNYICNEVLVVVSNWRLSMVKNAEQKRKDKAYFAMFDSEIDHELNNPDGVTGFQLLIILIVVWGFFYLLYVAASDFGLIRIGW